MPLKFNTANGAIIVTAEDGSGDAAVTFPRGDIVSAAHTGNVSITGDFTTVGTLDHTGAATFSSSVDMASVAISGTATMGDTTVSGEFIADSLNETHSTLTGTTVNIDCETGNFFTLSTSGNTTFTFSNAPTSGTAYSFTLKLLASGAHTITWPSAVDWAGGTAPDAPASGETDFLVFTTTDNGTTWYGFLAGDAMA